MTAASFLTAARATSLLWAGMCFGWSAHILYLEITGRVAIRRMVRTCRAMQQRDAAARRERTQTWHVEAGSPDAAWAEFERITRSLP